MSARFENRVHTVRRVLAAGTPGLPGFLVDQALAAERDAWSRLFPATAAGVTLANDGARLRAFDGDQVARLDVQATLLAAAVDCEPCIHVRRARGPMPVVVALGLHRASCERCMQTVRHAPAGEDDRCDVCGSRGNTSFRAFATVFAHAVFVGDAGVCCAERVGLS